MNRRKFDPETKIAIVLEGLKGNTTIAEQIKKLIPTSKEGKK